MRNRLFLYFIFGSGLTAAGQSTLSTLNGTVHDPSGAVVPNATVVLHRQESNTDRTVVSGADGSFDAVNLDPGTYNLGVTAPGFSKTTAEGIHLDPRQQLRYDVSLRVSSGGETVTVNATDAGTINTDNASISAALSPEAVLDLPANYRGNGSTSPLNVVQTLPGVQPDSAPYPPSASSGPSPGIKFSLQGGLPSQAETTVDGISAQNQTNNNVQQDAFPSAESIAEIRVDGVNNNAEYGQPGEITTVTKSGTNTLHGSLFEYFQNSALDAIPYQGGVANPVKPKKVANDFGATIGGPLVIPKLYNGRNRTFFFGTYEGLRFPLATVLQAKVPTVRMKQGDFSQEVGPGGSLRNPFTGGVYPGARLPSISPSSAAFLNFYPDPNVNPDSSLAETIAGQGFNYLGTRRQDIFSNQFDARADQTFGQKLTMFARFTWKNINQLLPQDLTLPESNAIGQYRIFATSANYTFTSHLADEFRFGFTLETDGAVNPFNGAAAVEAAGFQGLPPTPFFNGLSHIGFNDNNIQAIGYRLNRTEQSRIFQYVDNLTWQHGGHLVRVGGDIRALRANTVLGFTSGDNYGNFFFQPTGPTSTGQEFADFLLGVPYQTQYDDVNADNQGTAKAYAFYGQDNWKATDRLTLTYGLRYELHPPFYDPAGNIGNFDPSLAKSGELIYPAGHADRLSPEELANVNACPTAGVNNPYASGSVVNGAPCTPVVDNVAAGLPAGLRTYPKLRFMPRLGFAYRPFGDDKTVISGGAGYYNITTTGALFYALTGTLQANVQTFTNTNTTANGSPAIVFPNVSTASTNSFASGNFSPSYGSEVFYSSVDTNWHDPYSLQTNFSVERDLGRGFGLRVSYVGLKTWHLVWQPERNQLPISSTTRAVDQPRSAFPFPNFYQVYSRDTEAQAIYHSGQLELTRRFSRGLSFSSTYTFAKNLSDNQGTYGAAGAVPSSFADEQGGYNATDAYNRQLDYGNVSGTRRHRWVTTSVYELPLGKGKVFGAHVNHFTDLLIGGWQISGIFLDQSGPYLNASFPSGSIDPAGTGSGTLFFRQLRPDRVADPNRGRHNRNQWVNTAAFACPGGRDVLGNTGYASITSGACAVGATYTDPATGVQTAVAPIGRYGTESLGDIEGPGTINLSTGLSKSFLITERVHLRAEGTFTNVLNHINLADPNLTLTTSNFGQIIASRGSDFGGNRTGQASLRLEF